MQEAPKTFLERIKYIGPSVIVTGSVVGSGSIVMTPLLGAAAGFLLLWWLLLSMWSKPIIQAEISRYIVVTRKTFLEAFADMPGFKTTIQGKTTSWLVWFMFIGVVPSIAGMGGLAGAVAEAGNTMFPFLSTEIWVAISCLLTWLLLYFGSYKSLERTLLIMVLFFSFFLILINVRFVQIINPVPQIIVIKSILSLKKIKPRIVVKTNLEKSKDIRFVSFEILSAFVQQ